MVAALFVALLLHCSATAAPQPRPVSWSNISYGPDGPWQAIQVQFGTPRRPIDAYPGGTWESLMISPDICKNPESKPTCFAQTAGVYQPSDSKTAFQVNGIGPIKGQNFGTQTLFGDSQFYFDSLTMVGTSMVPSLTIPNVSTLVATKAYRTLPNGLNYSTSIGFVALVLIN